MSVSTFDNEKRHAVNQLILDYAVFVVWNDYVEQGSVDCHSNRELIQCKVFLTVSQWHNRFTSCFCLHGHSLGCSLFMFELNFLIIQINIKNILIENSNHIVLVRK